MWGLGPLPRQVPVGGLEYSLFGGWENGMGIVGFEGFALLQSPADYESRFLLPESSLLLEALSFLQQNVISSKAFPAPRSQSIALGCNTLQYSFITCPYFGLSLLPLYSLTIAS